MALIEKKNCTGEFLDDGQYSRNGILRYERIFGDTFVSTGGFQTTKVKLIERLNKFCQHWRIPNYKGKTCVKTSGGK